MIKLVAGLDARTSTKSVHGRGLSGRKTRAIPPKSDSRSMIHSIPECPSCGSLNLQEVVYGYPSPREIEKSEMGLAVLAGPQPFEGMPSLRCADCQHWWRPDGSSPNSHPAPSSCHFCGKLLNAAELTQFNASVREYWDRRDGQHTEPASLLFAYHPLPGCRACLSGIRQNQLEIQKEQQAALETKQFAKRAFQLVLLLWLAVILTGCILAVWHSSTGA